MNHSKTPEGIFKNLSVSHTAGLLPSPPDTGTTAYRSEIFVAEVYLHF